MDNLKNKIKKFRVKELKELLKFAKVMCIGKKNLLLAKVFYVISNYHDYGFEDFHLLEKKVDELFQQTKYPLNRKVESGLTEKLFFTNIMPIVKSHRIVTQDEAHCVEFCITPLLLRKISQNKNKCDAGDVEIQLKFRECLGVSDWEDIYLNIEVNSVPLEIKHPSRHIYYIMSLCKLWKNSKNIITIKSPRPTSIMGYSFDVSLVRRYSPTELVKQFPIKRADRTKSLVLEGFAGKRFHRTYSLYLICPNTKQFIKWPCRSSLCTHPDVFDLIPFLNEMQYYLKWKCPICMKIIDYDSLYIDDFLKKYLDEEKYALKFYGSKPAMKKFCDEDDLICDMELIQFKEEKE